MRGEADDGGRDWKDGYRCFLDILSSLLLGLGCGFFWTKDLFPGPAREKERERERERVASL